MNWSHTCSRRKTPLGYFVIYFTFPGVSAARTENTDSALKFVKQTDTNLLLHFIFFFK